jgi:hypothetical protein
MDSENSEQLYAETRKFNKKLICECYNLVKDTEHSNQSQSEDYLPQELQAKP